MKYIYLFAYHVIINQHQRKMQMWYLIIVIFILKSQGYLKNIYLVNKVFMIKSFGMSALHVNMCILISYN